MKNKAETRYNPFNGHGIIFAPKRQKRPNDIKNVTKILSCPFCPKEIKNKDILQAWPNKNSWQVIAKKNIFPALSKNNQSAYGYQEIIVDSRRHCEDFADLSLKQISLVLKMFQKRSNKLTKDKKINYILCFKNQGRAAGASLRHIHSQIFASAILPPDIIEEGVKTALYQKQHKNCPYCQLNKKEEGGVRQIYQDKHILILSPFASEFPYEAWIISRRHLDNICLLNEKEINSVARALKFIATKLKELDYDFNFFAHNDLKNPYQHFYLKVQPRPNIWAGVELGSGLIINQTLPEDATKYYKK
jgi:UDPglucose--hexose-1-phosphate uridylyltransferase